MKYILGLNEGFEYDQETDENKPYLKLIHEEITKDGKTYRMYEDRRSHFYYSSYEHYLDGKKVDLNILIHSDPRGGATPKDLNGPRKKYYAEAGARFDAAKKIISTLKPETVKMIKRKEHESDEEMLRYDAYVSTGGR